MSFTIAPAVSAALGQATVLWPKRSRKCDGTVGDLAHSSRTSDHNPDSRGVVLAFDLTHDPASGCDAHSLVRAAVAQRDRRIKYAISEGRIWSAARGAEGWRRYDGENRHDKHAHVSVNRRYENDTAPWWVAPKVRAHSTPPKEIDMPLSDDDVERVANAVYAKTNGDAVAILRGANHPSLTKILALLTKIAVKNGVKP